MSENLMVKILSDVNVAASLFDHEGLKEVEA